MLARLFDEADDNVHKTSNVVAKRVVKYIMHIQPFIFARFSRVSGCLTSLFLSSAERGFCEIKADRFLRPQLVAQITAVQYWMRRRLSRRYQLIGR